MNSAQTKTIEEVKAAMLKKASLGGRIETEIKKLAIEENKFFVSLAIEVGGVGDEGKMTSVLCRDYRHIFIGKRGGVQLMSVSMGSKFKSFRQNSVTGFFNTIHTLP